MTSFTNTNDYINVREICQLYLALGFPLIFLTGTVLKSIPRAKGMAFGLF
jgi:hypothetical protein